MAIHTLLVATNFTGTLNELPDCELDARNWRKLLKPWSASLTTVLGKKATREGIMAVGRKWLDRLEPGDLGVLLFSQHGTIEKIGGKWHEAIVCDDLELIYDFESADLLANRERTSHVVVLADTCHSGGMPRGGSFSRGVGRLPQRWARTIPLSRCKPHKAKPPSKMRALPNVTAYAGCEGGPGKYSYSTGEGGAMSLAMQQAMAEEGLDGSFGSIYRYVAGKNGILPSSDYPQTPQLVCSAANARRTLRSFVEAA